MNDPQRPPSRETASRYRITFAKTNHMRYTSHLDLQRTWERMMRRAELPILFSGGFHPRARFAIAAALPLGATGDGEVIDVFLTEPLTTRELHERLASSSPPGVEIRAIRDVPSLGPALPTLVQRAVYVIELPGVERELLATRVASILASTTLPRERRGKPYDLRPLIESLTVEVSNEEETGVALRATLSAKPGATGRADELLEALALDPHAARVRRERLVLDE